MPSPPDIDQDLPGCVLIVDDLAPNLRLLAGILRTEGYDVLTAKSGPEALKSMAARAPDVVLLDVMMPGMDGFEICRRIRAAPATAQVPVVMVTALHDTRDRVRAIEAGANDFLTKPVEETEVLARVRSLIRAKRDRDALEQAYRDLKTAEEARDFLSEMIVHDLRSPLTSILASLSLLKTVVKMDPSEQEIVDISLRGSQHLVRLVNELLDVSKLQDGELELQRAPVELAAVLKEVLDRVAGHIHYKAVTVEVDIPADFPALCADEDLVARMLVNLVSNALKFTPNSGRVEVKARLDEAGEFALIAISDNGEGVAPEDQEHIFTKFGQGRHHGSRRRDSTGLGLTFCRLVAEVHGGRIWVQSALGAGSTFFVALPLKPRLTAADTCPS